MNRSESENVAQSLLTGCDLNSMIPPVRKLLECLTLLKTDSEIYQDIDRSKLGVRLRPGPYRNRLVWIHQILVTLAKTLPFDDGKAKAFVVYLPETEKGLSDPDLFAPNIEWPHTDNETGQMPHERASMTLRLSLMKNDGEKSIAEELRDAEAKEQVEDESVGFKDSENENNDSENGGSNEVADEDDEFSLFA